MATPTSTSRSISSAPTRLRSRCPPGRAGSRKDGVRIQGGVRATDAAGSPAARRAPTAACGKSPGWSPAVFQIRIVVVHTRYAIPTPLPTIDDLTSAFHASVRARRDKRADGRAGSAYDYIAGLSAILWSRQAQRDRDLFRATYFDDAQGDDLTGRAQQLFGIARTLDTYGTGFATLARPNTAAGKGTVWTGTRFRVSGSLAGSVAYAALGDVPVQATDLYAIVPIRATTVGEGVAVASSSLGSLEDPLWDASWAVRSLTCADGTRFEPAQEFRALVRSQRLAARVGYDPRILQACQDAGAAEVALFRSDQAAADTGLNVCYVGDAGYSGSLDLVRRVTVALESVRVCGADMLVRPLTAASLTTRASISLWDQPSTFNLDQIELALRGVLLSTFAGTTAGFVYQRDALAGALARISDAIQSVTFASPASDIAILVNGQFPATLTRYSLSPANIFLTFTGPS